MLTRLVPATLENIALAAALLQQGGLVGFPTETVYGLGADALNAAAVPAIFAAKGRPADNPLIAHICSWQMGEAIAELTPLGRKLGELLWPGPLTLVLPRRACVPDVVTAGLDTVGVRWPAHPAAAELIARAGSPIAAPSANLSGRPSPTLAAHVYEDLAGRVPLILDGGPVDIGLESTVVDATGELPVLLRPGRITFEQLSELCGGCLLPQSAQSVRPPAPGMKYRHYAPRGAVQVVGDWRQAEAAAQHIAQQGGAAPLFILHAADIAALRERGVPEQRLLSLGDTTEQMAARLFACLRQADALGAKHIVCGSCDQAGLGRAVMNRLNKAAANEHFPLSPDP